MAASDFPQFFPNERVDIRDVEAVSLFGVLDAQRQNAALISSSPRVLDGFAFSGTGTTMTVTLGKALVAELRDSVAVQGQLMSEGAASRTVSFSGLAVGTYGVWVRFIYSDGAVDNRAFWNALLSAEQIQAVATRKVADWQISVSGSSPGPDWYKVVDVAWDGSALSTSTKTDRRTFLFEGPADNSYQPTWGGGNDRNADRGLHGVKDLERFASYVNKKFQDIQGTQRYWEVPTQSLQDKLSRFGDGAVNGNYAWTGLHTFNSRWTFTNALEMPLGYTVSKGVPFAVFGGAIGDSAPLTFMNASTASNNTDAGATAAHISIDMLVDLFDAHGFRMDVHSRNTDTPAFFFRSIINGALSTDVLELQSAAIIAHQDILPKFGSLLNIGDGTDYFDEVHSSEFISEGTGFFPYTVAGGSVGSNSLPFAVSVARAIRGKTITSYNSSAPATATDLISLNQLNTVIFAGKITYSGGVPSISANRFNGTATVTDVGVGVAEINFAAGLGVADDAVVIVTPSSTGVSTPTGGFHHGRVKPASSGLKIEVFTFDSTGAVADRNSDVIVVGRPRTLVTDPIL